MNAPSAWSGRSRRSTTTSMRCAPSYLRTPDSTMTGSTGGSASFVSAFEDFVKDVLMRIEGGYSDDPDDRGGATDFGVTQSTYDDYRDHHKLPRQPVKLINELEAWD